MSRRTLNENGADLENSVTVQPRSRYASHKDAPSPREPPVMIACLKRCPPAQPGRPSGHTTWPEGRLTSNVPHVSAHATIRRAAHTHSRECRLDDRSFRARLDDSVVGVDEHNVRAPIGGLRRFDLDEMREDDEVTHSGVVGGRTVDAHDAEPRGPRMA